MAIEPIGAGFGGNLVPAPSFGTDASNFQAEITRQKESASVGGEPLRLVQAVLPLPAPAMIPPPAIANGQSGTARDFTTDPAYRLGRYYGNNFTNNLGEVVDYIREGNFRDAAGRLFIPGYAGAPFSSVTIPDSNVLPGRPATPLPFPEPLVTPAQEPAVPQPIGGGFSPEELDDFNALPGPSLDHRPLDTTLPGFTPVEHGATILMSAAGDLQDLTGKTRTEADQILTGAGFQHTGTTAGGYENYRHPDGSRVYIRPNGEVIRTPPPEYGPDGSRTNRGARIGPDGKPTTSHNTGEIVKN